MRRIRIGNDLTISLLINRDGVAYDLTGKIVKTYLISPISKIVISNATINSNNVSFILHGSDQKLCGKYNVLIEIIDGDITHTLDSLDGFKLVDRSYKTGGSDGELDVNSVDLTFAL